MIGHTINWVIPYTTKNNSVSVMSDYRFHRKANPLSDDKKGINTNFKWRFCYE